MTTTTSTAIAALSTEALNALHCCWTAALDAAGGDFGFSSEAYACWLDTRPAGTQQQFAGLYGALVNAEVLWSDDEAAVNGRLLGESQYDFPEAVREYLWTVEG